MNRIVVFLNYCELDRIVSLLSRTLADVYIIRESDIIYKILHMHVMRALFYLHLVHISILYVFILCVNIGVTFSTAIYIYIIFICMQLCCVCVYNMHNLMCMCVHYYYDNIILLYYLKF